MDGLIGKTLGPYRILERIGRGGMATVYKAYQPSLDRDVAVKVLPAHLSEEASFAKRFQREARAVAKLEHPHILAVYDSGQEGDLSFIVMRYVEAGTLKDVIGSPLELGYIADLISQIAEALDHAHEMKVVHRDVKPSNVLLDQGNWALLTDFGVAKMVEGAQKLTATGVGIGTPAYMSPEQAQGKQVDRRSDVYSLGVVLYEMLTGRVPYQAETPIAVVLKHINDPLPLPRMMNPNIPEGVERIVLKAMAKAPEDRYQTAHDLAQGLREAVRKVDAESLVLGTVAGELTQDVIVEPPRRIWRLERLRRLWWIAPVVVLAIIGGIFLRIQGVIPSPTPIPTFSLRQTGIRGSIGEVDTGMGGALTIRGVVWDSSGVVAPGVFVRLSVHEEGGGYDIEPHWHGGLYTDETGAYAFSNILLLERGIYEFWVNGGQEYGNAYENSGYSVRGFEIHSDEYVFNVTVYPLTGSTFSGKIQYEDADGVTKNFLSTPLDQYHFISLERGTNDNHEYSIGSEYITHDDTTIYLGSLAGGTYRLVFQFTRSDGTWAECSSPPIEIPPGENKQFDYIIRDCFP